MDAVAGVLTRLLDFSHQLCSVFRKKGGMPENGAVVESDNFHAGIFIINPECGCGAYGLLGNSKNRS